MFSKQPTKAASVSGETLPARKLIAASLVAEGVSFRGDLATDGDLHLDGSVDGDLKAGHLTIGETGSVNGTIQAETLDIRGRVTGTISARNVRLWASAHVDGDITHAELTIETGAHFEGRSLVFPAVEAEVIEPPALSVVAAE